MNSSASSCLSHVNQAIPHLIWLVSCWLSVCWRYCVPKRSAICLKTKVYWNSNTTSFPLEKGVPTAKRSQLVHANQPVRRVGQEELPLGIQCSTDILLTYDILLTTVDNTNIPCNKAAVMRNSQRLVTNALRTRQQRLIKQSNDWLKIVCKADVMWSCTKR